MAGPIAISVDKAKSDGLRELRACVGCVIVALDGFAGFAAVGWSHFEISCIGSDGETLPRPRKS